MFDVVSLTDHDYYKQHNRQIFDMVLDATARLAKDMCRPILEEMDRHPTVLENGRAPWR